MHSSDTEDDPEMDWDPEVSYLSVSELIVDEDETNHLGVEQYKSKYSEGFLTNTDYITQLPFGSEASTTSTISWNSFPIPPLTSPIQIGVRIFDEEEDYIKISDDVENEDYAYLVEVLPGQQIFPAHSLDITSGYLDPMSVRFEIRSIENLDWQNVGWQPMIESPVVNTLPNGQTDLTNELILPPVYLRTYKDYSEGFTADGGRKWRNDFVTDLKKRETDFPTYKIRLDLDKERITENMVICDKNDENTCRNSYIYFVVRLNGQIVGVRDIRIRPNGGGFFSSFRFKNTT